MPRAMVTALALIACTMTGPGAAEEESLTLAQAIDLAMSANRTLAAARLSREVSKAGIEVAQEHLNPELLIERERETPHEAYTLTWPLELAAKRRKRVDLAEAGAQSNEAELAQLIAETRASVRRAYFTLSSAQRRVTEMEQVAQLAERTRDAAKDRFESGDAPRLEFLQADLNFAQSSNELIAVKASMSSARVELNTLLARPSDQATVVGVELPGGEVPSMQSAVDLAMGKSVELALINRRLAEAQARVNLVRAEQLPDLQLEAGVTRRSPPEFDTGWRAGIALTLPVLTHHAAEARQEQAALARLESEREAATARIRGSVQASLILASAQREQYERYRDQILPQAEEVERMAAESYRAGQTGLVTMLQALAAARDIRLKAVQADLDYQIALANLEQSIGAPLP